jgi:hypothetical protein
MDTGYIIQDPDHTVELIPDFSGFQIMPNSATHKYNFTLPVLHSAIINSKKGPDQWCGSGRLSLDNGTRQKKHWIPDPGATMNLQRLSICNSKTVTKLSEI